MSDPARDRPGYRRGVGMLVLDRGDLVLIAQRRDIAADAWQMPQGGIDPGETPLAAAWRELMEEIGTDKVDLIGESERWLGYDLPPDLRDKTWQGRYRGQTQKWFAFRFLGSDRDIDLGGADAEFVAWRWIRFETLPDIIVAFKRKLYQEVVAEFRHLLSRPARQPAPSAGTTSR